MKRIVALMMSAVILLCSDTSFVYADTGKYTVTDSGFVDYSQYSTRERAIACFIRAVGIDRFNTGDQILNRFTDKSKISYTYLDEMSAAVYSGLVDGYEDRSLRPQEPITRAEALVILNRALSRTELTPRYSVEFEDTPEWAKKQINRLAAAGIVKGYGDGSLGAYDYLTLEQVDFLCDRITRYTGPAGDYYNYVNSVWLESVTLDDGTLIQSETERLTGVVNNRISDIIFSLYRRHYNDGESFSSGSSEKKIIDVYSAAANQSYRDKIGLGPIKSYLEKIDGARGIDELLPIMAELETNGFVTLLPIELNVNIYNSSEYIATLSGCYSGVDFSLLSGEESEKYTKLYKDYLTELFEISGELRASAEKMANEAAHICLTLANATEKEENAISKSAVICDMGEFCELFSSIDVKKYLTALGFGGLEKMMLCSREMAEAVNGLLTDKNLPALKSYLKASVLDMSALYLNYEMFEVYQDFQNKLSGGSSKLIPSDYAILIVQELLGWEIGRMYIETYFSEETKKEAETMTEAIIDEYERLLTSCTRMTPQTRIRAIKKLKEIEINVAYPENISDYLNNDIPILPTSEGGNLIGYKTEYSRAYNEYCTSLLNNGETAERGGWSIYPQTVNAMYDPIANSITIPAGILQPPFFNADADYEENLGGIGVVIAHEISHAFDSTGSQFDEKGNLANWWSDADRNAFESLCERVAEQYDGISHGDGAVNGKLTLDENLADLAGMSCILSLAKGKSLNLGTLFENYARTWRIKATDEYEKLMLETDEHSPAKVRVNRVLGNFKEFESLYGITDGDGMYIPDADKINIWQ